MFIDAKMLKGLIVQAVSDLRHGMHEKEIILIGNFNDELAEDIQIHLTVTQNSHDFIDTEDPNLICINYNTPPIKEK